MKGLLLKDFYIIKDALIIQLIMLSVIGGAMSFVIDTSVLIVMSTVVFSLMSSTVIISDKTSKWGMFATTIPLSNTQVIRSKYILGILLIAVGLILGLILVVSTKAILGGFEIESVLENTLIGVAISLSSSSVSIPLSILFDDKKQVIAIIFSVVIPVIMFVFAIFVASKFSDLQGNITLLLYTIFSIGLIMFITSWAIAPRLLNNRVL